MVEVIIIDHETGSFEKLEGGRAMVVVATEQEDGEVEVETCVQGTKEDSLAREMLELLQREMEMGAAMSPPATMN